MLTVQQLSDIAAKAHAATLPGGNIVNSATGRPQSAPVFMNPADRSPEGYIGTRYTQQAWQDRLARLNADPSVAPPDTQGTSQPLRDQMIGDPTPPPIVQAQGPQPGTNLRNAMIGQGGPPMQIPGAMPMGGPSVLQKLLNFMV